MAHGPWNRARPKPIAAAPMTAVHFADPQWFHLVWAVLAFGGLLIALEGRGNKLLERFLHPAMQARLVSKPASGFRILSTALLIFAGLATTLALMRPQWDLEFIQSRAVGAEIMIAVDVSRSMLAEDVTPNRLERAKAEIRDLLPYLQGDQVGLIAFAGRAAVVCPLTPDFGFLRLVLDHIGPGTVARGGTRLAEPIRKASEGFAKAGDLARVILLFTDGEDHDSFPLDAAREAAERGIQVIVIGFGDESGSEIQVTDKKTGARTRVLDENGQPVISRLDGALLREVALETNGAYVPAGTGNLELESIYNEHLGPLMRAAGEARGRIVQKDGFQWPLLAALLALLASVLLGRRKIPRMGTLVLLLCVLTQGESRAQVSESAAQAFAPTAEENFIPNPEHDAQPIPEDPRKSYNLGLGALEADDLEAAERFLEAARSTARSDGETRYRATYNLSWVEVERAESGLPDDPEAALGALDRAADWLREAIALRPQDEIPRQNLEIILARALVLADAQAKRPEADLAQRLDMLITSQRAINDSLRQVIASQSQAETQSLWRKQLDTIAVEQRKLLADATPFASDAGNEANALEKRPEEERTPEEGMRLAQISAMLPLLQRAREKLGQSRGQLRRGQAKRAHRRAAAGLAALKRAREQFRDPVQILDGLIQDTTQLIGETQAVSQNRVGIGNQSEKLIVPGWLDSDYLSDTQIDVTRRTGELNLKLGAGLQQLGGGGDPQQSALFEKIKTAVPHVEAAANEFAQAEAALAADEPQTASRAQRKALTALIEAREEFLDLRGLIEVSYSDQQRLGQFLSHEEHGMAWLAESGPALVTLQQRNLERASRLSQLIAKEREALLSPESEATDSAVDPEAAAQTLELADGLLALTESAMRGAEESLGHLGEEPSALQDAQDSVSSATLGLENLRRLFFSIVEHLRDLARQQIGLSDETDAVTLRERGEALPLLESLSDRQAGLAQTGTAVAESLHEQALMDPAQVLGEQAVESDPAGAEEAMERFTLASELVLTAGQDMEEAAEALRSEPEAALGSSPDTLEPDFGGIRESQDGAVEKLAEAIALLSPPESEQGDPEPQEGDSEQSDPQQGQDEAAQQQGGNAEAEEAREDEAPKDPGQLLQAVRDREAARQRDQGEKKQSGYEPVEKDW